MKKSILLIFLFLWTTTCVYTQGIDNINTIVSPQKQALIADYLSEGAGASHIFGFFFLDLDTDKDGVPDFFETAPGDDLDGDGLNNNVDPDDDNDGVPDAIDVQPAGITSMPASYFRNGTVAEANGNNPTDYWQFVPNKLISGGSFDGYFEHPGAFLYVDNNANDIPDILEYVTGSNTMPPFVVDKGVATSHALLGAYLGLLGSWEYTGSPGATASERSHVTGSTIFYICDDDSGVNQISHYLAYTPYGNTYADVYANANGQVDYNIYGTAVDNSTLIPQEILGTDNQGENFWRYRWFEHIINANRETVYFASVFWNSGGSFLNTYFSKPEFNQEDASSFFPNPNGITTGDDFGGSGISNWYPRFQNTADHNTLAAAVFGAGTTWAMIASSPTDGSSPVALNPANQAWVDQYENWTTASRIVQYLDVAEWLSTTVNDANALINGRYGVDLTTENTDVIVRMKRGRIPHFVVYSPSGDPNSLVIGIEDIFRGGDRDFDDVAFYITDFKSVNVTAFKSDHYTVGQCLDTIQYKVVVRNSGDPTASGVVFNDTPDANTSLVTGSVVATVGSVTLGNTGGDVAVQVDIGNLSEGDSAIIYFTVNINNGVYPGVTSISNQGAVSGNNFSDVMTSDLDQDLHFQSTLTNNLTDLIDMTNPTISCPSDITMDTDPNDCEAVVTFTVTAMDNCPGVVSNQTAGQASGSAFPIGTTTNTFIATDAAGNTASCSFNITINDAEAPDVDCPADIAMNTGSGVCQAVVNFSVTMGDNCPGVVLNQTAGLADGSAFPTGTTTNTFVATDAAGNTASCSFNVTINDTEDPSIDCPADITMDTDPGLCEAVVTFTVTASDNCPGVISNQTLGQASGSAFSVGTTTNTFVATDAAGNTASCSFKVTINDNENPIIYCPADITMDTDPGICEAVVTFTATASDNCVVSNQTLDQASGSTFPVGSTLNTFIATDASGNTASCSFLVTINDTEAPDVDCPADITMDTDPGLCQAVVNFSVTASDNCPGVVSNQTAGLADGSAFPIGTTANTFVATDGSGNTASCSFNITINDTEAPDVDCPADITMNTDPGLCQAVVNFSVTASDNCPGLVLNQTLGQADGSAFPTGTTANTFVATDAAGNTASCSFNVTINDTENPEANCQNLMILLEPTGNVGTTAEAVNAVSTDNCGVASLLLSQTDFSCADTGDNDVTLSVMDAAGNSDVCTSVITVVDPVLSLDLRPSAKLWPPDSRYFTFKVADMVATVITSCGNGNLNDVRIIRATSDEVEDAPGTEDGNTLDDMIISEDCTSIQLRRERKGGGNGRVYTIALAVQDDGGATTYADYLVEIPIWAWGWNSEAVNDPGQGYSTDCNLPNF